MKYKTDPTYKITDKGEIIANGVTHAIGVALSIVGLIFLIIRAVQQGTAWHIVSFAIFGTSMIVLYLASTVYHITPGKPWNPIMQRLDHAAIYILIAGTYTPFLLTSLRSTLGWVIFGIIWGLAVMGMVLKLGFTKKFAAPSVVLYLLMGWLGVISLGKMFQALGGLSLGFLIAGGLLYTLGVIFYKWKKLPYNHAIWHLFVMGGTAFHYFSVINIL